MKVENEKMPEMSKDEVMSVAKQLGASDKLLYRLRTLVGRFDSGRLFLIGKDMDYKKFVKYGPRMKKLVTAIKEVFVNAGGDFRRNRLCRKKVV